jgi:transcriptional regulator with XRE-family HTH domain
MQENNSDLDNNNYGLGNRLRLLRTVMGINQHDLAMSMGLTTAVAVSKYEAGLRKPDYNKLSKVASFANVNLDWLITGMVSDHWCISFKKMSIDHKIKIEELAKKLSVTEAFVEAVFDCKIMPSSNFMSGVLPILGINQNAASLNSAHEGKLDAHIDIVNEDLKALKLQILNLTRERDKYQAQVEALQNTITKICDKKTNVSTTDYNGN